MSAIMPCSPLNSARVRPKALALLHVLDRLVERALRDADRHRRHRDAPALEHLHGVDEAHVELAAELLGGHPHVVEDQLGGVRGVQPELPVRPARAEARQCPCSRMNAEMPFCLRAGSVTAITTATPPTAGVGDERLGAVQDELVALAHRPRASWRPRPSPSRARSAPRRRASRPGRGAAGSAAFCSSEPKSAMWLVQSELWAHIVMPTEASTRFSSSTASA